MAVVDIFLKIQGVEGESQDAKHRSEIELTWWGWGVQQSGFSAVAHTALALPKGPSKALFQDLTFKHKVDKASPRLITHCAAGTHIPTALLTLRKAGRATVEFLKIKLSDVTVSSVTLDSDSTDGVPLETVSLQYAQIDFEYAPQKADGSLDTPITASCTP
jgi:type VI secretion system secreted protein Hcp